MDTLGTRHFHREVVLSLEVIIGMGNFGTLKCVLYREVFFYCVVYSECPLWEVPLY